MGARASRSAVTDTTAGELAAILSDVGQLVDVLDPRVALNTKASKPGVIAVESSILSAVARAISSCGLGNVGRGDLIHHFGGCVPKASSAPTLKI